jgi:hypothetical protein
MHKRFVLLVVSLLTATQVMAQIQPVVTGEQGEGAVDWANRTIMATGIGSPNPNLPPSAQRPSAERAAQQIAIRNALETIKGIYMTSTTTVNNFMVESDAVNSSVSGFVRGFQQKGRTRYMSDGSVEITMEVPLDGVGGLGEQLLGGSVGESPRVSSFEGRKAAASTVFSGLIIDCKGLQVKPALSPRIVDEDGREIYGSAYVSRDWAVKHGVVGYAKELSAAAKLDRVGKTPGSVKAIKIEGANNTDIVISSKDAADVRSASANLKFLSECRVIFVID